MKYSSKDQVCNSSGGAQTAILVVCAVALIAAAAIASTKSQFFQGFISDNFSNKNKNESGESGESGNTEQNVENFDATGLVYNVPPNWFIKADYDPRFWIVRTYPEQIQPECLSYSKAAKYGSLDNINYLSQAYRFWRF